MRNTFNFPKRLLVTTLCASLSACGGGGVDTGNAASSAATGQTQATTLATVSSSDSTTASTTTTWTECATEGGTCNFTGTASVRYGTATAFVIKTVTGPVACSNSVFGDPAFDYTKTCSVGSGTAIWTQCATEGGTCNFTGTAQVRYGTDSASVTKTLTGPVACSNAVFGDPAYDYIKTCSISSTVDTTATAALATTTSTTTSTSTALASSAPSAAPTMTVSSGAITAVQLTNTTAASQTNAPATFGQVFAQGDFPAGASLIGKTASGVSVPLQVDVKAHHADGSVRHAVITAQLPNIAANGVETVSLFKSTTAAATTQASPAALLSNGFTASFTATIGGVQYTASADALLKAGKFTTWLSGPLVNEWLVSAPLTTASGAQHPHLMAQFAIRSYAGDKNARVDVTVENDWAYEPSPQNFTYDASIVVGGKTVYSQSAMTHLHHTRWRKIYWYGNDPQMSVRHNAAYLIATRALPNYDQSLSIPESVLSAYQTRWTTTANTAPMGTGLITPYMPMTGGRDDIGLLPNWAVVYLLTQDSRMKNVVLGTADLAGSFSSHYRDKKTGRPVSLADYPYMTILGHSTDTLNPATGKYEAFPACGGDCSSPNTHDGAHQPSMAYLPYLVTGDYYYLEELEFWAMWDAFQSNPGYRDNIKGLVQSDQTRGQAWELRTLAEAAYIAPDKDTLKAALNNIVNNNLDWYNNTYTNNPSANKLGAIVNGYALAYANETGLAPWQDDFFTSAVGHAAELGFPKAQSLLVWKAQFPIQRMIGTGACWIDAAIYNMTVRPSNTSAYYGSIGEAYQASHSATVDAMTCNSSALATTLGQQYGETLQIGQMTGFSSSVVGYVSNMQPAMAYAAGVSEEGKAAWAQFMARTVKPNYVDGPQFDIVPR